MELTSNDLILVTGATGLVGSHVAEEARRRGLRVRALVRPAADTTPLRQWGVELMPGDITDANAVRTAVAGASVIVHCAAKVGDWGPTEEYREVNVHALERLLEAVEQCGDLKRFVHISSLGVYQARDHYGTDETEEPSTTGIDGYTLTKVEAERVVLRHVEERGLPAVVLRPGFIYGPRDRTVLPRLLERLRSGQFAFLGPPYKLMNNTYVRNLVDAIFLAIQNDQAVGRVYNITDGGLVSKQVFVSQIAEHAGYRIPTKVVPLAIARLLARMMEGLWKLLGKREAPLLSNARIKFLGLNLDYCIDRAKLELNYQPRVPFEEAMRQTIDWFRGEGRL